MADRRNDCRGSSSPVALRALWRWTAVASGCGMLVLSCSSDLKLSTISPGAGPARGGQKVTLTGEGFESGLEVLFGDKPAQSITISSSESLEAVTPPSLAGAVDVQLKRGGDSRVAPAGYTYLPIELRFVEAPAHYLPALQSAETADAVSADFNRDGHPDLFVAVRNGPSRLLLNGGTGSFAAEVAAEPDAGVSDSSALDSSVDDDSAAEDASTSDVVGDGDGVEDTGAGLAEAGEPDGSGAPGSGGLWVSSIRKLLVEDFDQDGSPDVFFCNDTGEAHRVLVNDGKGKLTEAPAGTVPVGSDECKGAAVADVDGDGRRDVIVLGQGPIGGGKSYVRVYLNRADGKSFQLTPAQDLEPAADVQDQPCGKVGVSAEAIAAKLSIDLKRASSGLGSGKATYDFGAETGTVSFAVAAPAVREVPSAIELDVWGDGTGNLWKLQVTDAKGELFEVELGAMGGNAWKHVRADSLGLWAHSGADSDGVVDLPLASVGVQIESGAASQGELALDNISLTLPSGGVALAEDFERAAFQAAWDATMSSVAADDVDGDGRTDLVVTSAQKAAGGFAAVVLNHSAAGLLQWQLPPSGLIPPLADPVSMGSLVDVDADGDLDLLAISNAGQDRLLVNDGTGHFFDDTLAKMPLDHSEGRSVSVTDLDMDGRPDLAIANAGTVNRLYLNHGSAGFVDATPALPLHPYHTRTMVPLDVEGDGDLDLFILNDQGEAAKLYVSVDPVAKK